MSRRIEDGSAFAALRAYVPPPKHAPVWPWVKDTIGAILLVVALAGTIIVIVALHG